MQYPLFSAMTGVEQSAALPAEIQRNLTREILRTELLRVKALIVTATVFVAAITIAYLAAPIAMQDLWRGHFELKLLYSVYILFVAFELMVLAFATRQLQRDLDVPHLRRYLGALIETSLPTFALYVQIKHMGAQPAFGFVAPMVYFIFIILSTLRLDFWLSTFTGAVAAVELLALATLHPAVTVDPNDPTTYWTYQFSRSVVLLLGGVLAGAVGMRLRAQFEQSVLAASARDRVTNLFGQHVSPQVVERLLRKDADGPGDTGNVAVMFVDIRGFTAAARERDPRDVVKRLDDAFGILVEIVDRNGGIVNKFLGDGFLALFGAPIRDADASRRAVVAAREMLDALERDNKGNPWPLRIGIGLHCGVVVAGNVGSPRRKEYTVIGDTVNCAARLEALNKDFGSQIIVSDAIYAELGQITPAPLPLGDVEIRGYDKPMKLWRLA
jgi:adenylate cyclase